MKQYIKYFILTIVLILIHSQTFAKNRGLENCGSSCYFNSCIQSLSHMNDLNSILNAEDYPLGSIPRLYLKLLPILKAKKRPLKINSPIEAPETIESFYLTAAEEFFETTEQEQDASEFLTLFLNCFKNKEEEIDSLIQCSLTTKTRCSSCQNISPVASSERVLNVDIPKHGSPSIINCLNKISETQTLNDYKCDACNKIVTATKLTHFTGLPRYLIISLKRFRGLDKKFEKAVKFDFTLSILPYAYFLDKDIKLTQPINYKLFAFIVHAGTLEDGHYWAYAKDEKNFWYQYNDESVLFYGQPNNLDKLKKILDTGLDDNDGTPYVLFYELDDTSKTELEKLGILKPAPTPVPSAQLANPLQQKLSQLKLSLQKLKTKLQTLEGKLHALRGKLG